MELKIPFQDTNGPWHRKALEKWIRANVYAKGHNMLMRVAGAYGLDPLYAQSVTSCVLIHWILDKIITDATKSGEVKCLGDKFGLVSSSLKRVATEDKRYKIKGIDDPRGDLSEFNRKFVETLAHFIGHGLAETPSDQEGVDIDILERMLGTSIPNYLEPPTIRSPGHGLPSVSFATPPLPSDITSTKGLSSPLKKTRVKRVVDLQDIVNMNAEIDATKEGLGQLNCRMDGHEARLAQLEMEMRRKI